eukprot:GILJ01007417.1.p1 GENE.GILJ01007417.1~~GILJ01007417.1.p1  ORF type:complete len:421 (-),score=75.27 GILJ01007417.1:78-1292(-)
MFRVHLRAIELQRGRHFSLWKNIKENFRKDFLEKKENKEALEQLRKSKLAQVVKGVSSTAEKTGGALKEKVKESASSVAENASAAAEKMKVIKENALVRAVRETTARWKAAADQSPVVMKMSAAAEAFKRVYNDIFPPPKGSGGHVYRPPPPAPPPPPKAEGEEPEIPTTTELVVSKVQQTAWDRVASRLKEMPLLNTVFGLGDTAVGRKAKEFKEDLQEEWETTQNPLLLKIRDINDRLFGETETAQAIRQMKEIDPSFRLYPFIDEVQYVVAPQVIGAFLKEDLMTLHKICTETVFSIMKATVSERHKLNLVMDTTILDMGEVEMKTAKPADRGSPLFVFTLATQQINCLRDKAGKVVDGAIDDIRQVHYAIVLQRHSEPHLEVGHLWQVAEIAILGSTKTI